MRLIFVEKKANANQSTGYNFSISGTQLEIK